ncbi:MAG: hypothetical protein K9H16_10190 [Bacteroidales bacterium]|nr:hypothetical protein [Bacteroidales bacterium]
MDIERIISELKVNSKPDFDKMELLKTYPEPVSRYLRYHLPNGIPDNTFGEIRLKGIIKLVNWSYFKSTLFTNPFRGFLWKANVKMGIIPVKGFDFFLYNQGAMNWKLFNILNVMKADGDDVSRSAEGRAKMEGIFFPHLLIHPKMEWEVISENEISVNWKIHREEHPVHLKIGNDGSLREIFLKRWGNPGGIKEFSYYNFGSYIEQEILYKGVIIPKKGNAGWWFGEKAYDDGEFFRFEAY